MNNTPNTQAAADRLRGIGQSIRSALAPVMDSNASKSEAQELFQDAIAGDNGTRETTILTLANLAAAGNWSKADIDAGVRFALDGGNAKLPKSIETYAGQAKVAMHPNARDHVSHLFDLGNIAWAAEVEVVKATKDKSNALLARTFSRKFHMLMQMCGAAAAGVVIATTDGLTEFAEAKDPQFDATKQANAVLATIETLTAIYANFPCDDLKAAMDCLADVNAERLKQVRAASLVPAPVVGTIESAPKVVASVVVVADPVAEVQDADAMIDDLLGNNLVDLVEVAA